MLRFLGILSLVTLVSSCACEKGKVSFNKELQLDKDGCPTKDAVLLVEGFQIEAIGKNSNGTCSIVLEFKQ
jgi:hypothetical protein